MENAQQNDNSSLLGYSSMTAIGVPLFSPPVPRVSKAFSEGVVINLQLSDL